MPSSWIDGTRIAEIIRRAAGDEQVRLRLFYCPEELVADMALTPDEAYVVRTGDLSRVLLDDELLDLGRTVFEQSGSVLSYTGSFLDSAQTRTELCT